MLPWSPSHVRDKAQPPMPRASHEDDEACAEEEDGLAGGFAGSTTSLLHGQCVWKRRGQKDSSSRCHTGDHLLAAYSSLTAALVHQLQRHLSANAFKSTCRNTSKCVLRTTKKNPTAITWLLPTCSRTEEPPLLPPTCPTQSRSRSDMSKQQTKLTLAETPPRRRRAEPHPLPQLAVFCPLPKGCSTRSHQHPHLSGEKSFVSPALGSRGHLCH